MTCEKKIPIIGICGWKASGKTTLCERLIKEFSRRGLKVSSIKHTHHEFDTEATETDSARHQRAGAQETMIIGTKRWAIYGSITEGKQPSIEEILNMLSPADLIIIEGYKSSQIPKIETRRSEQKQKKGIGENDPYIIAIASDYSIIHDSKPVFSLNSIGMIADFIDRSIGPLVAKTNTM